MRLVDAVTVRKIRREPGLAPQCFKEGGDGYGSGHRGEDLHYSSRPTGAGDGTHGTCWGNGRCTVYEYHLFGGDHMQLTLLQAWRYV